MSHLNEISSVRAFNPVNSKICEKFAPVTKYVSSSCPLHCFDASYSEHKL